MRGPREEKSTDRYIKKEPKEDQEEGARQAFHEFREHFEAGDNERAYDALKALVSIISCFPEY